MCLRVMEAQMRWSLDLRLWLRVVFLSLSNRLPSSSANILHNSGARGHLEGAFSQRLSHGLKPGGYSPMLSYTVPVIHSVCLKLPEHG